MAGRCLVASLVVLLFLATANPAACLVSLSLPATTSLSPNSISAKLHTPATPIATAAASISMPMMRTRSSTTTKQPVSPLSSPLSSPRTALRGGGAFVSPASTMSARVNKALFAEFLGTFMIVLFGTGIVAHASMGAVAGLSLPWIAAVWGVAVAGAAHILGPLSGAHINPCISIALAMRDARSATPLGLPALKWLPQYIVAQVLGASAASGAVAFMFNTQLSALSRQLVPPAMACYPAAVYGLQKAFASEVVGTAFLAFGALSVPSPWHLGAWLTMLITVFAPFSGASFNPARELGPRIVCFFLGFDTQKVVISAFVPYLFAQVAGAVIGVYMAGALKKD